MSQVVKMDLANGGSVLVEVADADPGRPVTRGGRQEELVESASASMEQALAGLGPVVNGLVAQLRQAADWPDEVSVEFAVKLSADANVIIARAGGEANFKISMSWSRGQG